MSVHINDVKEEERKEETINAIGISGTNANVNVNNMTVIGKYTKITISTGKTSKTKKLKKEAIWFDLRAPVKSFTGRNDKLEDLHNALGTKDKYVVVSQTTSIIGLGGVGKSELARKYTYDHRNDYDGNAVWINAETQESLRNSFKGLAEEVKIPITEKREEKKQERDIKSIVKDVYKYFKGTKSLFIFDNVEEYNDIKELLPSGFSLSPEDEKPNVLITSRNRDWEVGKEGEIEVIKLNEFTTEEAVGFVKKALNIENNLQDENVKKLTEVLQHFPLALGQATAYIINKNEQLKLRGNRKFEISDYLVKYEKEAEELLDFESKYENDRYTKTTLITWKITLKNIEQKGKDGKQALEILEIMAYLAPEEIRIEEILSKLVKDKKKLWKAVKILNQYSMINLEKGVSNIHRLVQQVIRLGLQKEGREEEILRKVLELINSADATKKNVSHVISVWAYASKYSELVEKFIVDTADKSYNSSLPLLAKNGCDKVFKAVFEYIEKKHPNKLTKIVNTPDKHRITPLHEAAKSGNLEIVKLLIENGADVRAIGKYDGSTSLHYAVESCNLKVVKFLIKNGADINITDKFGATLLHKAAESSNLEIVEFLVKIGMDIEAPNNNGKTPLYGAVKSGNLEVVKFLIESGANINVVDNHDQTLLHSAVSSKGNLDFIKFLIEEKGFDVNANSMYGTPLHEAVRSGNLKFVKFLIKNGADVKSAEEDYGPLLNETIELDCLDILDIVKFLIENGSGVNARDEEVGWSPLISAARSDNLDVIKLLVAKGANVNLPRNDGHTPLHEAAENGYLEVVKFLIENGACISALDERGSTPLCSAVWSGKLEVVRFLIEKGADINEVSDDDETLLHRAVNSNHSNLDVIKFLVEENKFNVNASNNYGRTPLSMAVWSGHLEDVKFLIENDARVKTVDNGGKTLLHFSASPINVNLDLVKYLIEDKGLEVNAPDKHGNTPLHSAAAAWCHNVGVAQLLIENGSDINTLNEEGRTPLHEAAFSDNLEVVKLLIDNGADVNAVDENKKTSLHIASEKGNLEVIKFLIEFV